MRFLTFINEIHSEYGSGITFIDIDETIFRTFAKIHVIKSNKVIKKLNNKEFNIYKLGPGEKFGFDEFRDAKIFKETSIPIESTVNRIVRMLKNLDRRSSTIILLTARPDFDNKETFLNTFRDVGIDIDKIYVERTGNLTAKEPNLSIAEAKKRVILKYISTGDYRRVRLVDDDMKNIKYFLSIRDNVSQDIIDKVKEKYKITKKESIAPIEFYALYVQEDGKLKLIK